MTADPLVYLRNCTFVSEVLVQNCQTLKPAGQNTHARFLAHSRHALEQVMSTALKLKVSPDLPACIWLKTAILIQAL